MWILLSPALWWLLSFSRLVDTLSEKDVTWETAGTRFTQAWGLLGVSGGLSWVEEGGGLLGLHREGLSPLLGAGGWT